MRINHITKLFFALAVFAFASCADNDVYNPDTAKKTGDLNPPANFDWELTSTTTCSITSPVNTRVSIYSDRECKDNQLLAEVYVSKDKATEIGFDLPTSSTAFFIKYPTANGFEIKEVATKASTRAADYNITLPEVPENGIDSETKDEVDYFYNPGKGAYGTVMFEDRFPEKGDYDFNDFVVGYKISSFITRGDAKDYSDGVTINLQIRALGGSLPYSFGFELTCLQTKYVRDNYEIKSDTEGIDIKLISTGDEDPAVFLVTGTNILKDGSFYNTEKRSTKKMPNISCKIERFNKNDLTPWRQFYSLAVNSNQTNFFIQKNDGTEIHLKGYPVTKLATNTDSKFHTDDNFVWGLKIPYYAPNATERTDFTEAYPNFADWVTSGGKSNTNWFKDYKPGKVIRDY